MARHLRFKLKKEIMGDSVIVEECDSDDQSESVGADVYELTVCHHIPHRDRVLMKF
jgi:hypothetical protein